MEVDWCSALVLELDPSPKEKVVCTWQRAYILFLEVWMVICVTLGTLPLSETVSLLQ